MKILFFARLFYPHVGGVEKHVFEISKRLILLGHTVTVVTEQFDTSLKLTEKKDKVTIFRIPVGSSERNKKFVIWKWLYKNRELMKDTDIIHCHDVFFWYFPFRFVFNKPVFTTFHGYEGYPISKKAIIYRKLFEYMSSRTICVGDFMRKWYHAKPTFVTYGATDLPKKPFEPIKNSIVFVGRLDDQTGIKTYVEAFKQIKKQDKTFTLTIYGNGIFKKRIRGEGIVLKGFVKDADNEIGKYEFAFVSRYLAILEAMAARRLVFAVFDNSLKEDYLKMTPFSKYIVVASSSSELVSKFTFYLDNPDKKEKMVKDAYNWVVNNTWEEMTNIYVKLWKPKMH